MFKVEQLKLRLDECKSEVALLGDFCTLNQSIFNSLCYEFDLRSTGSSNSGGDLKGGLRAWYMSSLGREPFVQYLTQGTLVALLERAGKVFSQGLADQGTTHREVAKVI